ncbi:ribosome assembly factor SBDS [Nanoarchaeota archaeon]|nr:MAG: ribosome assembly factor SBDS [Nanoarchaeota archaeon]
MVNLVSVDKAVIATIERNGRRYEVLVDSELAWELKKGKNVSIEDILAVPEIFADARKGEKAGNLSAVFGTDNIYDVAKEIILHGKVPMSKEYRHRLLEEKTRKIVDYISRNAIDARTNAPIPPERVEKAIHELKVNIDPLEPVESQINKILTDLRRIIPLSFERKKLKVVIPSSYAPKVYGVLKKYNKLKEEWLANGDYYAEFDIAAGMLNNFYDEINKATKGNVTVSEVK